MLGVPQQNNLYEHKNSQPLRDQVFILFPLYLRILKNYSIFAHQNKATIGFNRVKDNRTR